MGEPWGRWGSKVGVAKGLPWGNGRRLWLPDSVARKVLEQAKDTSVDDAAKGIALKRGTTSPADERDDF